MRLGRWQIERGYLVAAIAGAVVAAAAVALVFLAGSGGSDKESKTTTAAVAQPTTLASTFGDHYHPATLSRRQELDDPYWLGPELGPYPASLQHESGDVERAVFAYTDRGDLNRPHVLVRVLEAKPFPGGIPSAGSTLVAEMGRAKTFPTPTGPAALTRSNAVTVRPDKATVVEITVLDDPNGALPPLPRLARMLKTAG